MSRMRWISTAGGLVLGFVLVAGWQGSWGQTAKKARAIAPEECLSAESVVYFRLDGTKAHQAEWEKTGAYKALVKSGLTASIDKWLSAIAKEEPKAETGRKLFWQILENGVSLGFVPPIDESGNGMQVTVVLHNGAELMADLTEMIPLPSDKMTDDTGGVKRVFSMASLPDHPQGTICWWAEGPHLVYSLATTEKHAAGNVIDVLSGETKSITSIPDWKRRNAFGDGQILTGVGWVDLQRILEKYRDVQLPNLEDGGESFTVGAVASMLGLDNVTELLGRQGYDGKVCVSQVDLLYDGPRRGVLKLYDGQPMSLDQLPPLPEYSTVVMASSMDWAEAADIVLGLIRDGMEKFQAPEQERQDFEDGLKQVDEAVGGSVRNDFLAHLGPAHAFFNDPANAILGFGYGLAIQVKDAEKVRGFIQKALQEIPEESEQGLRVVRHEKGDREVISIGMAEVPIFPAFTVDGDWLVVGLTAQTVDAFLDRRQGELDPWEPTKEHLELLERLPKEFLSFSLSDPREGIRMINQYIPVIQGALASSPEMSGIPMMDLPSVERIIKPMFPTATMTVADESGIHYHSRQCLPGLPLFGNVDNVSPATSAIAVALLLPAVQQAREAARRTQSKNNLKQIGLALHNYHDTYNKFPAGVIEGQKKPEDSLSWYGSLLPYLDQAPLYKELDQKQKWDDEANERVGQTVIPSFRNPSAKEEKLNGYAQVDYAGVAGLGKDGPNKKLNDKGAGMFAYNRATRVADVTDGLSNTLMVGDISKDRGPWLQGGKATIRPFVDKPYINGPDGWGGNHAGGAHFLMGDGAVRFVSQNIDPQVLEALVTIRGGEVIGDF